MESFVTRRLGILLFAACVLGAFQHAATQSVAARNSTLSVDQLSKLRRVALADTDNSVTLNPALVALFTLGSANETILARQETTARSGVDYIISFPLKSGSDDVIFSVMKPGITQIFLSDSTLALRLAAVLTSSGVQLLPKKDLLAWEKAVQSYQTPLNVWSDYARNLSEPR